MKMRKNALYFLALTKLTSSRLVFVYRFLFLRTEFPPRLSLRELRGRLAVDRATRPLPSLPRSRGLVRLRSERYGSTLRRSPIGNVSVDSRVISCIAKNPFSIRPERSTPGNHLRRAQTLSTVSFLYRSTVTRSERCSKLVYTLLPAVSRYGRRNPKKRVRRLSAPTEVTEITKTNNFSCASHCARFNAR